VAFLLRTVSRSAEGREIVRTARIEGDRLTIGRDPASGVHLTDLAVALHHATVERTSPGRLEIAAGPGLYVDLNGRKTARGAIDVAGGGDLRIGAHLLRFLPASPDSADIEIAVERVTDGGSELGKADERQFSLASKLPGKRPLAWGLALLVLGIFLAWPIWSFYDQRRDQGEAQRFHADRLWLSGSLSQVHASLQNNCTACHAEPFVSVRDESCQSCHVDVHDHGPPARLARARPGLDAWGRLRLAVQETFNLPAGRCVDCHTEHEGPQEMAPTPQRFCADCHSGLAERLPDSRLGDASDFGRVHPEFQPSVLIRWDGETPVMQRVSLGARPSENSNLRFPHRLHLDPNGGPAQMGRRLAPQFGFGRSLACADCHVPTPDGTRFQPVDMEEDCGMCHSLAFDRVGRAGGRGSARILPRPYPGPARYPHPRRPPPPRRRHADPKYGPICRGAARLGLAGRPGDPRPLHPRRRLLRLPPDRGAGRQFARLPDPSGRLPDPLHAPRLVRPRSASADPVLDLPRRSDLALGQRPASPRSAELPDLPWRREFGGGAIDLRNVS
jgi:hypothetical protein